MPEQQDSDRALLRRIARQDHRAIRELYERYYRRLFSYVFKITRRSELVEEVLNDVMLAVWRQADSFAGRSRPSTWIFGIAYRQSMKALRRSRRDPTRSSARLGPGEPGDGSSDPSPGTGAAPEPDELPGDDHPGPESLMVQREQAGLLGRALATLSPEQRTVVELTFFHGFSYPEIAEIMDCPLGTVKSRMFHARNKLREALPRFGLGEERR